MKQLTFWFDVISPYAYLAFEQLPTVLEGLSYDVEYRPILFAGLLTHWGQKGPAEIGPKRAWTYRQIAWAAHVNGIELQVPSVHPFNPLPLLRLAYACALPNRRLVQRLFQHVWIGGGDAADPARLEALRLELAPLEGPADEAVKLRLRQATDDAIARGIFGVPSIEVEGRLFWGADSLPMVRAAVAGDPWFESGAWEAAGASRAGVTRR